MVQSAKDPEEYNILPYTPCHSRGDDETGPRDEKFGVVKHSDAVKVYVVSACAIRKLLRCIIQAERRPSQGNLPGNKSMHEKVSRREKRDEKRELRARDAEGNLMTSLSDAKQNSEHSRSGTKNIRQQINRRNTWPSDATHSQRLDVILENRTQPHLEYLWTIYLA